MMWIIGIFLNILIISAQEDEPCVMPTTSTITIGLTNYICAKIVLGNQTFVYSFPIKVDKVSVLSLTNLSSLLINSNIQNNSTNENISLRLQFQNSKQVIELLLSNKRAIVYRNLISVVIRVNRGIFSALINDSQDCQDCNFGENICYENECFKTGYFQQQSNLLIYVTWIGTDLKQQHMVSYTHRLKKLSRFSLGNIYSSAFSIY